MHVAAVEVDQETGKIKILDYLVTEDVGRKINPMIIEGQMAGGLAQGIGGALLEEFVYNEDGQPLSTNFMDYLLPTAMEVPKAQLISTEDFPARIIRSASKAQAKAALPRRVRRWQTPCPMRWVWKSKNCRSSRTISAADKTARRNHELMLL